MFISTLPALKHGTISVWASILGIVLSPPTRWSRQATTCILQFYGTGSGRRAGAQRRARWNHHQNKASRSSPFFLAMRDTPRGNERTRCKTISYVRMPKLLDWPYHNGGTGRGRPHLTRGNQRTRRKPPPLTGGTSWKDIQNQ